MLTELRESESPLQVAEMQTQLQRLLAHPLFRQSKRYPALLQYVVEESLQGRSVTLKERSIGVKVFGRDFDYNVAGDPVVRVTASEVRRRLAQYYVDPAHAGEPRIELYPGSYIPSFTPSTAPTPTHESESQKNVPPPLVTDFSSHNSSKELQSKRWIWIALLLGLSLGSAGGFLLHYRSRPTSTQQFWKPVLASRLPITICIGAPKETSGFAEQIESVSSSNLGMSDKPANAQSISDHYRSTGLLQASDVTALTRITTTFANAPYRIRDAADTDFTRLQESPTVLIGGVDNAWTMRLMPALPYRLSWNSATRIAEIDDSRAKGPSKWRLETDKPYRNLQTDYALVARFRDPTTGQIVVIVAGLGAEGTEAASELVANPRFTNLLLQGAPKQWQSMNLEAVVSTNIIFGEPGLPNVLATAFWK